MSNYLSPGLYVHETDFSYYVKTISTSAAAMIGVAQKGPINKSVLVTSWEQFITQYGSYCRDGYLAYAARSFFDNGGSVLYVNRIAHYTNPTDRQTLCASCSSATVACREEPSVNCLRIKAINEGVWGDQVTVVIEEASLNQAFNFNVTVRYQGAKVEVFQDVSMDESKKNYVETVINGHSPWIVVEDMNVPLDNTNNRPAFGHWSLTGGNDGLANLADSDFIGDESQHTGFYALDEIDALNLVMVPGITTASVLQAGITYAQNRKDMMLIAEVPLMLNPLQAIDFRKGQGTYNHQAFNSSYSALYYPWLLIKDPVTSQKKWIPPSGAIAGCIARSDQSSGVWNAPAGIDRGRIVDAKSLSYLTSKAERDVLYPQGINVIASFSDSGIHIWGQKTLQTQPSATDRINVRRLMMYMEKAIAQASRFVVFEPNHPKVWRALGRLVNPFLQDMKDKGAVYDFAFQCNEETNTSAVVDRNEMIARVFIKPVKTAEFIELNFILSNTGSEFKELI